MDDRHAPPSVGEREGNPIQQDFAGVRSLLAPQDPDERALAGTVGARDPQHFPCEGVEVEPSQGMCLAVVLPDSPDLEGRHDWPALRGQAPSWISWASRAFTSATLLMVTTVGGVYVN